ncbi:TonB-dependent receptor plug domain-containing protein [Sphingoaurantiacus capsulatus]|uniref:TonB-dependent receptor plug domain-containing protein n=1 Tax=Sphingoaurantiacus capsulatus TaxID=1771310 RepID=A0ABV7X4C1_9SPHN
MFRRRLLLAAALLSAPTYAQETPEAEGEEEAEEIVVQATRSGRRVHDEPIRVEVLNREEIEEKILMRPGNIAMLLSETGGVRLQTTSPALGAANIRVLGMKGRYTQLLADGLPLYGGQASSLGLLQIAPTDLGQVEVIKGAASALYGPSALGGVVNLVARRPGDELQVETLANLTSRGGQDLTLYSATPIGGGWGASVVGGYHRQDRQDLDDDGWLDMAGFERWTARPRLFWEGDDGATAFITVGAMTEERVGGTKAGRTVPDGRPFVQAQDSDRFDAGLVASYPIGGATLHIRAAGMLQDHRHQFGDVVENDEHDTAFAEASVSTGEEGTSLLAGFAVQTDGYRSKAFPAFDYRYTVPAIFAQAEHDLSEVVTLAGSARLDDHSEYGTKFSPRVSLLYRPERWTVRASVGSGFYAPTPFVEEIEAAGLSRLAPLAGLKAETAESASIDVGYRTGPIEANVTLFGSHMHDAVRLEDVGPARVQLVNFGTTRTYGTELMLRYRWNGFTLTGSYVHLRSTEPDAAGGRRTVPLTPRNTAGFVAMWEEHGKGRVGFEAYYTGRQQLDNNPFRTESKPYVEMGLLGEIVVGNVRLFVNAENILNVRQTKYDPLIRPVRATDGNWTVDGWAPAEGFTVNGGLRFSFGGQH